MQAQGKFSSNLYRLNTATGRNTIMTLGGPGDVQGWVVDRNQVARAAVSSREGVTRVHLRDAEQAPWRVIFEFGPEDILRSVTPLAFDAAGNLYVSAYAGADNAAIYRYNVGAGKLEAEPLAAVKGFDLAGGLRFSADGQRLLGVDYEADREGTYWVDDKIAKWQASVDKVLPDRVNRLVSVVEDDLGLPLHRAVEGAKVRLSKTEADHVELPAIALDLPATRAAFDDWIADDLAAIDRVLDDVLARAGVDARAVDRVFATGGSSLVPAVRGRLAARFGAERVVGGEELTSVAWGLAARAREVFG